MSVRAALLVLMVVMVVQAAVALPAGVIIEGRRGSCDHRKCLESCKARYEHIFSGQVKGRCIHNHNKCTCAMDYGGLHVVDFY